MTFTRYATAVGEFAGTNDVQGTLFVAPVGGSPSSMTVTVDPFPDAGTAYQSMVGFAVTEGEILQAPVGNIVVSGDTTHTTASLPTATTSGNLVIAGFLTHTTGNTVPTAPSGFTLLNSTASNYEMTTVFYSTTFVGTSVTCPDLGESLYVSASWLIEIETPSAPVADKYTELEWNLALQAPAATSDVYEFRVYAGDTPLDAYAVTAQLTVEAPTGGVNYNETGRSITIVATTTATDQADFKEPALSVPIVTTTTITTQYDIRNWLWRSRSPPPRRSLLIRPTSRRSALLPLVRLRCSPTTSQSRALRSPTAAATDDTPRCSPGRRRPTCTHQVSSLRLLPDIGSPTTQPVMQRHVLSTPPS